MLSPSSKKIKNQTKDVIDTQYTLKNAKEISRGIMEKKMAQKNHFKKVLELCYMSIKQSADMNCTHCIFEVPEFLIGHPLYDINECIVYILRKLQEHEYQVSYYFPRTIYIVWNVEESDDEKVNNQLLDILNNIQTKHTPNSQDSQGTNIFFGTPSQKPNNNNSFLPPHKISEIEKWNENVFNQNDHKKIDTTKPKKISYTLCPHEQEQDCFDKTSEKSKKSEPKQKVNDTVKNEIDQLFFDAKNMKSNKEKNDNKENNIKKDKPRKQRPAKTKKPIKPISELQTKFVLDLS